MIGILLVVALLLAGFFHSPLCGRHKKALLTWLAGLVLPCCKPAAALASNFPLEASPACCPAEKQKDVDVRQPATEAGPDAELEPVFRSFDRDGDGFITAKELEESLRRLGLLTDGGVEEILHRVDSNRDGLIDMDEFRELYDSIAGGGRRKKDKETHGEAQGTIHILDADEEEEEEEEIVDQEVEMREAFEVFDKDGDGKIGAEELMAVLGSTGLRSGATEAECRQMIEQVDLDGDGMVNFHEFKRMMMFRVSTQPNQQEKGKVVL